MKLKAIALPPAAQAITFNGPYLAVEFLRRLRAYAAFYKVNLTGNGYRPVYDQISAYIAYKNGKGNPAAYPGQSWHNCGLAFDVNKLSSGAYPATMPEDYKHRPLEQAMNLFGLCIPMWSGSSEKEPWHITPVECLNVPAADRQLFLDRDDLLNSTSGFRPLRLIKTDNPIFTHSVLMRGSDVQVLQEKLSITADKWFGPDTEAAVEKFQAAHGLTSDGICGPDTWAAILEPDYKALYLGLRDKVERLQAKYKILAANVQAFGGEF